eukprot:326132-Prymnesium_polylepis.2
MCAPPAAARGTAAALAGARGVSAVACRLSQCVPLRAGSANDLAKESKRTTVTAQDVINALKELEFDEFVPSIEACLAGAARHQIARAPLSQQIAAAATRATPVPHFVHLFAHLLSSENIAVRFTRTAYRESEKARTIEAAAKKAVRVGERAAAVPDEGDDAADGADAANGADEGEADGPEDDADE